MNLKKMSAVRVSAVMVAGLVASSVSASAISVNPFEPAAGFNIFVEKNFTIKSGHPEGAVALGGDLTFKGGTEISQKSSGSFVAPGDTKAAGLVVGGSVNFAGSSGQLIINKDANVKIGGGAYKVWDGNPSQTVINNGANINTQPRIETRTDQTAASIAAPTGIDFASAFDDMAEYAQHMAALSATRTGADMGLTGPNKTLNNFGLDLGLNVINLTGAEYRYIQNINWNNAQLPSAERTVIFNIDVGGATSYDFGYASMGISESYAPYVLFNFYNLDGSLNLIGQRQIVGSILAPNADITKKQTYQHGQVAARNYVFNDGEVHFYANQVTYNWEPPVSNPQAVPEGSALFAGAAALIGLFAARNRMKRTKS